MEPRPELDSLCCLNPECKHYARRGEQNLTVRKTYGTDQIRYLRCHSCGAEFSERRGSALFNCKVSEARAVSVIEHLDSGCGLRATAKLVGVARDTVSRLVRVVGRTSLALHQQLVKELRPRALQFDEKWSYTGKKEQRLTLQDDPQRVGDRWDVNCLDPETKLLVSLVPGKRTAETIEQAVQDAASRLAAETAQPAIFTDGEPAYEAAIRQVFGHRYRAPRHSHLGRPPVPVLRVPQDLVYAQVLKQRQAGRVVEVEIRPIFGKGKLAAVVAALGWQQANTSAIERFNLTDRQRNKRKARKTLSFSRRASFHDWMSWITALRYNFHHAHRSLRQRQEDGQWWQRTPAMAAKLIDHICSSLELLRLCPVGLG